MYSIVSNKLGHIQKKPISENMSFHQTNLFYLRLAYQLPISIENKITRDRFKIVLGFDLKNIYYANNVLLKWKLE